MTHKAYAEMTGANVTDISGNVTRVEFDEPKPKMIASGDEEFCKDAARRYVDKHPEVTVGVIESTEAGDPWHNDWRKVHTTPGF